VQYRQWLGDIVGLYVFLQCIFLFSLTWSIAATSDSNSRTKFDALIRELMEVSNVRFYNYYSLQSVPKFFLHFVILMQFLRIQYFIANAILIFLHRSQK